MVITAALSCPAELGLPFASCTLDRLVAHHPVVEGAVVAGDRPAGFARFLDADFRRRDALSKVRGVRVGAAAGPVAGRPAGGTVRLRAGSRSTPQAV